jgi:hypothetical protein
MATGSQVLQMLCPLKEWTIYGDDYDSIIWHEGSPYITKKQFEDGFVQYDAWKAQRDKEMADKKAAAEAKLTALGLTSDDLKALGLG